MEDIKPKIFPGDIVQIINAEHAWFPCLIIVSEIKSFGIQGYSYIPHKEGATYIRLKYEDIELCGKAKILYAEKKK